MPKLSKEEIIKRANNYIDFMKKEIKENKNSFVECNKKAISDFKELQGYMSIYKYGTKEYQEIAYNYMKKIFS